MTQAKAGATVRIHYTGTLSDGSVFDSSEGRDPLEFQLGAGAIIPGLERAIDGMTVGDQKTVTIPCAEAYGDYQPEARQDVPRDQIPLIFRWTPAPCCKCKHLMAARCP